MYKIIIFIWLLFEPIFSQPIIGSGLTRLELFEFLNSNYKPIATLGYNQARDVMYSIIDLEDDNTLKGIYTNYTVIIDPNQNPRPQTNAQNMNCEHSWPQSMGAGSEPQKSDLHHLYPCRVNVNSSRGNKPYADIDDNETDKWWRLDFYETNIPSEHIDEFSEVDNDNNKFEPREDVKGNIARSMFYFYTIYKNDADEDFFNQQKEFLYQWHKQDPVDNIEMARTLAIAIYQDNLANPYVLDSTLVKRIWYFNCYENVTSQELIQNITNHNNYDSTLDIDANSKVNIFDLIYIINRESGENAYFVCN